MDFLNKTVETNSCSDKKRTLLSKHVTLRTMQNFTAVREIIVATRTSS